MTTTATIITISDTKIWNRMTASVCIQCVRVKINKRSFEPFCVNIRHSFTFYSANKTSWIYTVIHEKETGIMYESQPVPLCPRHPWNVMQTGRFKAEQTGQLYNNAVWRCLRLQRAFVIKGTIRLLLCFLSGRRHRPGETDRGITVSMTGKQEAQPRSVYSRIQRTLQTPPPPSPAR